MQIHENHLVNYYKKKKKPVQILIGIILNPQISLGETDILGILNLLTHNHGISFILFRPSNSSNLYFIIFSCQIYP